jgi:Double zinc ribbon
MSQLKCIACHKPNNADDRFCASCGSSLDLKLCQSCEAINNPVADHCHNCGQALSAEPAATTTTQTVVQAALVVESPPFYAPRQWQVRDTRPSAAQQASRWAKRAFFIALPLVALAVWAHQFYGQRMVPTAKPVVFEGKLPAAIANKPPAVQVAKPAAEVKRAPKSVAGPEKAIAQTNAGATTTAVVAAPVAPAMQSKPVVQKKPVVVETAPPPPGVSRGRVTHTRAAPAAVAGKLEEAGESAPVATETVAGSSAAAAPAARTAPAAGNCPPPVAVLGLCNANIKGGN